MPEALILKKLLTLWQQSQDDDWQEYLTKADNPLGIFSVPQLTSAVDAGKIISERCNGLILDIGCGCYPHPSYMQGGQFMGGGAAFAGLLEDKLSLKKDSDEVYVTELLKTFNRKTIFTRMDIDGNYYTFEIIPKLLWLANFPSDYVEQCNVWIKYMEKIMEKKIDVDISDIEKLIEKTCIQNGEVIKWCR